MDQRPIFVAAHPRAISTAFERVFMTQRDNLTCLHEPFGDAFYYGPERLSERFENDETKRIDSGFSHSTYQSILDRIERESAEGKRLFIKDIIYYIFPPDGKPASIAPSIAHQDENKNGISAADRAGKDTYFDAGCPDVKESEPHNPTVIPEMLLRRFHFAFLIRHPRYSIPSFWRCTIPPLIEETQWHTFMTSEAGYDELRRLFDYLRSSHQVGPKVAGQHSQKDDPVNGHANGINGTAPPPAEICVIDADDLLADPEGIIRQFCQSVNLEYDPSMLVWNSNEDFENASSAFAKWKGWHNDVLDSQALHPKPLKKAKSETQEYAEWVERYGPNAAKTIKETVEKNVADYEYLKQFALKLRN